MFNMVLNTFLICKCFTEEFISSVTIGVAEIISSSPNFFRKFEWPITVDVPIIQEPVKQNHIHLVLEKELHFVSVKIRTMFVEYLKKTFYREI